MATDRSRARKFLSDRGLYEGVAVEAKWDQGTSDAFSPGRISRVNVDGTLTVLFDDGWVEDVSANDMRVSADPWWRLREGNAPELTLAQWRSASGASAARPPPSTTRPPLTTCVSRPPPVASLSPPAAECDAAELREQLRRYIVVECGGDGASVDGWQVDLRRREGGAAGGRDLYYFSPTRQRFRSRVEVARHLGLEPASNLPGSTRGHAARSQSSPPPHAPSCQPPRKRAAVASTAQRPTTASSETVDDDDGDDDEHTTELLRRAAAACAAPTAIAPIATAEGEDASADDDDECEEQKGGESAARARTGTDRFTPALGADRAHTALRVLFFLECHSGSCRVAQAHLRHVRRARLPRAEEREITQPERNTARAHRNGTSSPTTCGAEKTSGSPARIVRFTTAISRHHALKCSSAASHACRTRSISRQSAGTWQARRGTTMCGSLLRV